MHHMHTSPAESLFSLSRENNVDRLGVDANGDVDEAKLRSRIRTEIDNVARQKSLQGYEIPREFVIEWAPFTKENHLITDSNKMARGQLKKKCAPELPAVNDSCLYFNCEFDSETLLWWWGMSPLASCAKPWDCLC